MDVDALQRAVRTCVLLYIKSTYEYSSTDFYRKTVTDSHSGKTVPAMPTPPPSSPASSRLNIGNSNAPTFSPGRGPTEAPRARRSRRPTRSQGAGVSRATRHDSPGPTGSTTPGRMPPSPATTSPGARSKERRTPLCTLSPGGFIVRTSLPRKEPRTKG